MTSAQAHQLVEDFLHRYRSEVAHAMRDHLPSGEPRRWLYDLVASYPARRGKGLRAALCIASCRAFGGSLDEALPTAAAIELLHNAFLIHDDVEDGSEQRRGRPTLHVQYGIPLAVNAGDGLAVFALQPLRANLELIGERMSAFVADEIDLLMRRTIEGQAIELGWRADNIVELRPADYLEMIFLKTCAYTAIHPMRAGALIGSWGTADLEALGRFGFHLGAAFQIRDDVLNLTAEGDGYGKEALGDLYEGKRTLMVIHLLAQTTGTERERVTAFLAKRRSDRSERDVREIHQLMHAHGCIEYANEYAAGIADAAAESFGAAFATAPDTADRRFIEALIRYVVDRDL